MNLDLVELDPNADPPVCRVMDFGKWKFEQSKKQQAAKTGPAGTDGSLAGADGNTDGVRDNSFVVETDDG